MFLLVQLSKSKFFHSCSTHVVRVALVLHLCHSCSSGVAHVLHSYCLCLTRIALVSLLSHSCRIRAALVVLVLLASGARVIN